MENEQKEWWQSRTIWTGVLTAVCALLKSLGLIPEAIDTTIIDEVVTVGLGIATIYFRAKAEKTIRPVVTPVESA